MQSLRDQLDLKIDRSEFSKLASLSSLLSSYTTAIDGN